MLGLGLVQLVKRVRVSTRNSSPINFPDDVTKALLSFSIRKATSTYIGRQYR
jgi:hypothetical protein